MNKVYLIHPQGGNLMIEVNAEKSYITILRNDISMVIADEIDVGILLEKRCGCNCGEGNKKPCFRLASLDEINAWSRNE